MASKISSEELSILNINTVKDSATFMQMQQAGQVNENELYLIGGDNSEVPKPTAVDEGKTLIAEDGEWTKGSNGMVFRNEEGTPQIIQDGQNIIDQLNIPHIYASTSEPDPTVGKLGDLWVVYDY